MSKRIIAWLLSLTLILGTSFSMTVFADETDSAAVAEETVAEETAAEETVAEETEALVDESAEAVDEEANLASEKLAKSKAVYDGMLEEIGLLKSLEIMSDANEENMLDEVTRAQFVRYMLQLLNINANAAVDGENTYYYDVPTDYEYYNDISTATVMGLIHGTSDTTFNPENTISYQEALKILVGALDYGTLAQYRGGYPQGYIAVAKSIKLTDNVTIGYTENVTMKELVQLLFNALNSTVAETNLSTKASISITSGENLFIEDRFDVVKYKGVVTGTSYTRRLEGNDDLYAMEIDGVEYNIGRYAEFDEEALLGQRVYFYVKYSSEDRSLTKDAEVIFVNPLEGYNKIVEVIDEDIYDGTNTSTLEYWDENDNRNSINIANAIVFYNGKVDNSVTNADLKPERGSVRAIDNNRDGKYDYVFIKNSVQRLVDVATSDTIRFKYGHGELEVPANDKKILLYRYGAEITTDYLAEWEVLEIMLCKDGESGIIDVSKKILEGKVNSVGNDEYTVVDEKYDLSDEYMAALEAGHFQAAKPTKGSTCQFVLDSRGEIAAMTSTLTAITEYGYLVKAVSDGGLDKTNKVKIYCQYGVMNIFPVEENARVNGRRLSDGEELAPHFYNSNNVFEPQLVSFTRNNGVVTQIDKAVDTTGGTLRVPGTPVPEFSLDYFDTTSWTYDSTSYMVEGNYILLDSTVPVFWIPFEREKESLYKYYDSRTSLSGLVKTTDIYVYDSTILEDYVGVRKPGAIVLITQDTEDEITEQNPYTLTSITVGSTYYVVDTVEETGTNSDGMPVYTITMSDATSIVFEDKVYNVDTANLYGQGHYTLGNLEKGDVIQVGYGNDSSKANRFVCICTAKGNGITNNGYVDGEYRWWNNTRSVGDVDITTNPGTTESFLIGQLIYKNNPYYVFKTKNSAGEDRILTLIYSSGTFNMYEKSSETVWKSSYWNLEPGQTVLLRVKDGKMAYGVIVTD